MNIVEKWVTGVIAIGLVTAFGLHAANLATLTGSVGKAGSQIMGTAEKG